MRTFEEIEADLETARAGGRADEVLTLVDELRSLETPQAQALALLARGRVDYQSGDLPAALDCFRRAHETYEELGDGRSAAGCTVNVGSAHLGMGDYPEALECFHRARSAYEETEDQGGLASILVNIGLVHHYTGDYPSALQSLHKALDFYEELGDRDTAARQLTNIGNVHFAMKDAAAALEQYSRALAIHEDLGDRAAASAVIGNIGTVHLNAGDYSQALEHYRRARALHDELGMRADSQRAGCNLGLTLVEAGRFGEARVLLEGIREEDIEDPGTRLQRSMLRARLLEHDQHPRQASEVYSRALQDARRRGLRSRVADAHKALRDLARTQNDLPRYVEHNDAYLQVKEEIRGAEARLQIAMQQKQKEVEAIERAHERARAVLYSTLPRHVADRVIQGEDVRGDHYDDAAVVFLDIVGFTALSSRISPDDVVRLLDTVFTAFDDIVEKHQVVKIKTIGDAYLAVAFPMEEGSASAAQRAAATALEMIEAPVTLAADLPPIRIRVGLHVGPVVAGIIGSQRLQYDVWGDTVNTASRMENTGEPGRIHVSEAFATVLQQAGDLEAPAGGGRELGGRSYRLIQRGAVEVKGKGSMNTCWLEGRGP